MPGTLPSARRDPGRTAREFPLTRDGIFYPRPGPAPKFHYSCSSFSFSYPAALSQFISAFHHDFFSAIQAGGNGYFIAARRARDDGPPLDALVPHNPHNVLAADLA